MPDALGGAGFTRRLRRLISLILLAAAGAASPAAEAPAPVVAAAASVRFALEDVARSFHRDTGQRVRLSLGSSGNLTRQIRAGAPYELFLSADPVYVEDLARDGFTLDTGKTYLLGRLAIVVPHGSPLNADGSLEDLRRALAEGRVRRFAIANPEHAPYGQRAEEVLRHAEILEAIRPYLVLGENVGQAAQFAVSGNAEGGIIGFALARAPAVGARGTAALIPGQWHTPLRHRAVLLKPAGDVARQFFRYLDSSTARETFRSHGFDLPAESR